MDDTTRLVITAINELARYGRLNPETQDALNDALVVEDENGTNVEEVDEDSVNTPQSNLPPFPSMTTPEVK